MVSFRAYWEYPCIYISLFEVNRFSFLTCLGPRGVEFRRLAGTVLIASCCVVKQNGKRVYTKSLPSARNILAQRILRKTGCDGASCGDERKVGVILTQRIRAGLQELQSPTLVYMVVWGYNKRIVRYGYRRLF